MAIRDFLFPDVQQVLGLTLAERDLFGNVAPLDLPSPRNGFCDFILTRSPLQSVLTAPVVAIVEAKNDNLRNGLGQCIAAVVAARELNARLQTPGDTVQGAVTTGSAWKFLRLTGSELTLDLHEYFVAELGRIMGILAEILRAS
jgi:hypothetical protein